MIGLGIDPANAARIRRWVSEWNLPVAVTPKVKGIVDETAANFVGVVGGMAADGVMCDAIAAADLRRRLRPRPGRDRQDLARGAADSLGARIAERGRHRAGGRRARRTTRRSSTRCVEQAPPATWPAPFKEFQEKRERMLNDRAGVGRHDVARATSSQALASVMPPETIVTTDVGSHKYLFGQFWPSRQPETFWMSNGLSGMAYGLSAAIGAKLARPGCAGARGGRRRRLLDERAGARDRRARRRAVHHRRARRRQLLADQDLAGRKEARAVSHGFPADRHREDGGGVRRRRPAHQQPRRARRGRQSARSTVAAASSSPFR